MYSQEGCASILDFESKAMHQLTSDYFDTGLGGRTNKRATLSQAMFKIGRPISTLQYNANAMVPPWTSLVKPPQLSPTNAPPWSNAWTTEQSPVFGNHDNRSHKRKSAGLENLVDRTGRVAVGSRTVSGGSTRRRAVYSQDEPGYNRDSTRTVESKQVRDNGPSGTIVSKSIREIVITIWPNIDTFTRIVLCLGGWGATVHAIISPVFSYVLSKLLRLYSTPGDGKHQSLIYSMVMLGLAFVDAAHTYVFHFFLEYVGQCWVDNIRAEALRRILDQPRVFFDDDENATSRLVGCLDQNAEDMRNLVGRFLGIIWIAASMSVASLVWAMVVQWKMTLIALAAGPYILGVTKAYSAVSERWEKACNDAAEDVAQQPNLAGLAMPGGDHARLDHVRQRQGPPRLKPWGGGSIGRVPEGLRHFRRPSKHSA